MVVYAAASANLSRTRARSLARGRLRADQHGPIASYGARSLARGRRRDHLRGPSRVRCRIAHAGSAARAICADRSRLRCTVARSDRLHGLPHGRVGYDEAMAIGLGCMRLSTDSARDPVRGRAVIAAAVAAGIELLDTSDAYALD